MKPALSDKRHRLVAAALFVAMVTAYVVIGLAGRRQADREVQRIEAAAHDRRADTAAMLGSMFGGEPNPVAVALDVGPTDVTLRNSASGWCAIVSVRRLLTEQTVLVAVAPDGLMRPVEHCPP